ncbi:MAG TPA: Nramp family divalent metal transporter [Chloroflexia bacterium]|nr:Nramp family divalent metal transporter [Chloroflexia bacterium]
MADKASEKLDIVESPVVPVSLPGEMEPDREERKKTRRGLLFYLSILGPGLIAANAGNDAGGIATYSTMGAQFGFQMLWVMVIVGLGVAIVQEMCARMGAATGKGLSDLIRENFPIRLTAFVMLAFLVANGGVIVSEFIGIASALDIFGIPQWLGAPVAGLLVWLLIARGSYSRVEKVFLALTIAFFAYIVAAFMAKPDWIDVVKNSFVPTFQFNSGFISLVIAAVGTTISPYMQIYVQSAVVERGVTMRDYKYQRIDVYSGSAFSIGIAYFIIVATGATIFAGTGGQGKALGSAADAAQALAPFLGDFAKYVFALGLLGASFLAAGVLPLTTCYSVTEALGLENGVSKSWKEAPAFWTMFTVLIVIGVIIATIPGLPVVDILVNLYLLNGLLLPIVLFAALKLVNDRNVMGKYTNGKIYNILAYSLATIVSLLSIFYLVDQVLSLFNINLLG